MLVNRLCKEGGKPFLLDGDVMRHIMSVEGGHDRASRFDIAMLYSRLCHEISEQGIDVICATISMFHKVRLWNHANMTRYREIYLRAPLETRRLRDPKGLCRQAESLEKPNMVGIDIVGEEPQSPGFAADN